MTESLITRPSNLKGKQKQQQNPDSETGTSLESNTGGVEGGTSTDTGTGSDDDTSTQGQSSQGNTVDWEKRYKDLQSFHTKRENELKKQLREKEKNDDSFKAPTTPEEMETFKKNNPSAYNMMLTLAHDVVSKQTQGINEKLEVFEQDRKMSEINTAKNKIKKAHPDYLDIVQEAEFHEWAESQPSRVQEWIYNNPDDPDLAIIALDRYKATRNSSNKQSSTEEHSESEAQQQQQTKKDRSNQQDAASAVSGGQGSPDISQGKKVWTASEIKKIPSRDWKKYEEEIDRAYAEGRVNFKA